MDKHTTVSTVGSRESGYLFEFRTDGVFLTVYPQETDAIMFELSDMRQILSEYSVLDYNLQALAHACREASGKPVKLGDRFVLPKGFDNAGQEYSPEAWHEANKYREFGKVTVDVSADRMVATLRFDVGMTQSIPTIDMIHDVMSLRNIKYGISEEAIKEAAKTGRTTIVARGVEPQHGIDAKIIRHFNMGEKGVPVVNEHDRADYKNLNMFLRASKGQVLAERIPHTLGTPGTNVHGDKVNAKNGKPKPVPSGKNTSIKDDNFVVADINGQIVDSGSKISVDPRLEIKGDVGMATGNIDFDGAVSVGGNIEAGFSVKATGDIEIKGMISGADVEGRNIIVGGGVQGMNRGFIKAAEDFHASFAENADIEAGGDVYIQDVAMHSTIRAGHHIIMDEGKGQITGGNLAAGEEIRAKRIGNEANVGTRITVGVNPMLQKEYQTILKEYNDARKRLDMLNKTLNTLDKIDIKSLPADKQERLNALIRSQFPLAGTVERDERKLREIDAELQKMRNGRVRVLDTLYPGVKLNINSILKNVQAEESHCTQYVKDDFIVVGAY